MGIAVFTCSAGDIFPVNTALALRVIAIQYLALYVDGKNFLGIARIRMYPKYPGMRATFDDAGDLCDGSSAMLTPCGFAETMTDSTSPLSFSRYRR